MIKDKDIEKLKYIGKQLVEFRYTIEDEELNVKLKIYFSRESGDSKIWNVKAMIDATEKLSHQVIDFSYELPKIGMNVTLIAAIGLKYLQIEIKEDIQKRIGTDIIIGSITEGM